jgi:transposase
MHKIREIFRQKWCQGRRHRQIARSLGISTGMVGKIIGRAREQGLDWSGVEQLSDTELEQRLYGLRSSGERSLRVAPDCSYLDVELRKKGVTLQLLHLEYLEQRPEGYRYTQFCEHYRRWRKKRGVVMRQIHRAGEKLFVDYSGDGPHFVDPSTGEIVECELFVAVLGASNYTFVEATLTQQSRDWIGSNTRALEFLGGVPEIVIPDQLRSGVSDPCRYEPRIQRTYHDWAGHYGTTIIPARPRKPRDKAKVESGVLIAQRWILARLRHHTFFSLAELNARIRELVEGLNARVMKRYGASRRELFERLDRPALSTLPVQRFEYADWLNARVNIDYHVEVDHHFYSAPFTLFREQLDVRLTATTVELLHRGERVGAHRRSHQRGGFTTDPAHMPSSHRKHLEWSPTRMIRWGETIGPHTARFIESLIENRPHPEQGYRSCLGTLRLEKHYGAERLEIACARALSVRARSYRHVHSILKKGLDRLPLYVEPSTAASPGQQALPLHDNLRGPTYYGDDSGS